METRGRKAQQYALYKGDEFMELGYIKDIAAKTGIKEAYLYSMTGKKRTGDYSLDRMEEE